MLLNDLVHTLEQKILDGNDISQEEALQLASLPENQIFELLTSANRIREAFHGNQVRLCAIVNAKSGICPEDCAFCAQSVHHSTDSPVFPLLSPEETLDHAKSSIQYRARAFSIVTSGKQLESENEILQISELLSLLKQRIPLERCASLGILGREELAALKKAGLQTYHHNLETAESFFPQICTTHGWEESVNTVQEARALGLRVCCGGIFGMGETINQRLELAFTLRSLKVDSVPLNFLNPIPGTPLENSPPLRPLECLETIALYRFILPRQDILICGGREVSLRSLQPLMFTAGATGIMIGNYLTTEGQSPEDDIQMIKDLGLTIMPPST